MKCVNLYLKQITDPLTHVLIGRAYVDLLPLQCGLYTIGGWYNISDLTRDIKG